LSIRTALIALALVIPFAASATAASEARPYEEFLLALGVAPEDFDQVIVEQRTWDGAAWTTSILPIDQIPTMPTVAPAPAGLHATVGQLPIHLMLQFSCEGYGAQALPGGVTTVSGSWDLGLHALVGAIGGGVVVDSAQPDAALLVGVHEDSAATAAGQLSIGETRITIFGFCLALLGQMSGTGVFVWDEQLI
jgi:hypothetical protein